MLGVFATLIVQVLVKSHTSFLIILSTLLAILLLSFKQMAFWGNPITSASPHIDYFISADAMEHPYRTRIPRTGTKKVVKRRGGGRGVGGRVDMTPMMAAGSVGVVDGGVDTMTLPSASGGLISSSHSSSSSSSLPADLRIKLESDHRVRIYTRHNNGTTTVSFMNDNISHHDDNTGNDDKKSVYEDADPYVEQLVLLEGSGIWYYPPATLPTAVLRSTGLLAPTSSSTPSSSSTSSSSPSSEYSRSHFGIPPQANIYLSAQSVFKLHPSYEHVIMSILRHDPKGVLVFTSGRKARWTKIFMDRLDNAIVKLVDTFLASHHVDVMSLTRMKDKNKDINEDLFIEFMTKLNLTTLSVERDSRHTGRQDVFGDILRSMHDRIISSPPSALSSLAHELRSSLLSTLRGRIVLVPRVSAEKFLSFIQMAGKTPLTPSPPLTQIVKFIHPSSFSRSTCSFIELTWFWRSKIPN